MSVDFLPLTPIRMPDLFDGRLKDVEVHEHRRSKDTVVLTNDRGELWVYGDEDGLVACFTAYAGACGPDAAGGTARILVAIENAFDVKLVSEDEPQCWGFETQEEWDAATAAGYWTKGEWDAAMAGDLAIARWPRGADVATIARSILGTLKYKPHTNDTTALRRALESVIDHAQCCDPCGQPATAADPLSPYDGQGRPDGIWLHRQCEAPWFDSAGAPLVCDSPDEIARVHIARCEAGDMQAIKDLADRLDGRPAPVLEHSGPDSEPSRKIVREIGHVTQTPEDIAAEDEVIEWEQCARPADGRKVAAMGKSTNE